MAPITPIQTPNNVPIPSRRRFRRWGRALLNWHLLLDERQHNITVNLIDPGHTAHFESLDQAVSFAGHADGWQTRDRATPQDIADAILFLCSEEARFITGSAISFALA